MSNNWWIDQIEERAKQAEARVEVLETLNAEMLELLDECRLKLETCGYLPAVATKVCELIAKAKGGE